MPIYEYECRKCEKRFEKLVKSMNTTEKVVCPSCGSKQVERAMSVFAVSSAAASGSMPAKCQGCAGAEGGTCPMSMED